MCPCDKLECGTLSTLVLRLCERDTGAVLGWPSFRPWPWAGAGWPSESRNARLASEFLRIGFTVGGGAVAVPSVSDPVGVGGSAVLGAGRGGGIDKRWLPPNARAFENALELVVAILYTLLDVLVRFEATCRLEMILGSVFCDCEEVRLGERSLSYKGNPLFCHGGGWGTVDTGVAESSGGGVGRGGRLEDWRDQRRTLPFSAVVELLDTEFARGFPRSDHALSIGGRVVSGTGTPKLPAVLALPWLYTSCPDAGDDGA